MASRNHAVAIKHRSTAPLARLPLKRHEVRGLLGELLLEALQRVPSERLAYDPMRGTDKASEINTEAANDPSGHPDISTSPADLFFSDIKPPTKSSREERQKEAMKLLQEAQRVLAFTNPDLKGKSRAWGRNAKTRKMALETVDQLVNQALRDLTAAAA